MVFSSPPCACLRCCGTRPSWLKQHTVNLHVIPSTAMNLLVVLGVRFLAPLEMTDTMLQIMLP